MFFLMLIEKRMVGFLDGLGSGVSLERLSCFVGVSMPDVNSERCKDVEDQHVKTLARC